MAKNTNDDILNALLTVEDIPEAEIPMKRFGVNFRVRAVDIKTIKRLNIQATFPVGKTQVLDEEYFAALLIAEASVVPNWKDPQLLAKYETTEPAEVIRKRLLGGEMAHLSKEIMDVSGFNQEERIENLKN